MNSILLLLNTYFIVYSWKMATKDFEMNNNFSGWVFIFLSALNAAAVATNIF